MRCSWSSFSWVVGAAALAGAVAGCGEKMDVVAPPDPVTCVEPDSSTVVLDGTVGGEKMTSLNKLEGEVDSSSTLTVGFAIGGRLHLGGDSPFDVAGPVATKTAWFLPQGGGSWFCDSSGAAVTSEKKFPNLISESMVLPKLRKLGACPGKPVTGAIKYCLDVTDPACKGSVSGTLADHPFKAPQDVGFVTGTRMIHALDSQGLIDFDPATETGVLIAPQGGADGGAVYCISSVKAASGAQEFDLSGFSRLGACAEGSAVAGALSVCMSF